MNGSFFQFEIVHFSIDVAELRRDVFEGAGNPLLRLPVRIGHEGQYRPPAPQTSTSHRPNLDQHAPIQ